MRRFGPVSGAWPALCDPAYEGGGSAQPYQGNRKASLMAAQPSRPGIQLPGQGCRMLLRSVRTAFNAVLTSLERRVVAQPFSDPHGRKGWWSWGVPRDWGDGDG